MQSLPKRRSSTPATTASVCIGVWLLPLLLLLTLQPPCECRYLPTRSHGDDLDKLRELMLQILESSNEDSRPPNEPTGNAIAQQASWLSKLNAMDMPRKYGGRGYYEGGHYY